MAKRKRDVQEDGLEHNKRPRQINGQEPDKTDADPTEALPRNAEANESALLHVPEEFVEHVEPVQRPKRKKRRKSRGVQQSVKDASRVQDITKIKEETQAAGPQAPKVQTLSRRKKNRQQDDNEPESGDSDWRISDPVGGCMLDLDPVFSPDEQHLLVAYDTAIAVYSTSTSLPTRRLRVNKGERITAYALSSSTESQLYVSTISGSIEKWDWIQGLRIQSWKLSSAIHSLTALAKTASDVAGSEMVYTVDRKGTDPWLISAHRLAHGDDTSKTDVKTLFKYKEHISSVQLLEGGRLIVATSGSQLILGNTNSPCPPTLQELSYTWRIVECPEWIISVDARISYQERVAKPSKGGRKTIESLDIAVGGLKGSIHIYENLLGNIVRREQPTSKEDPRDITARRLHWHRNAVLALKWSQDGNYLISGGEETVLVLWQLETGKKQNLPHLGAPIESIVVSPFGSSYGIRLADNSSMIISTSELRPTFSVAGIQTPPQVKDNSVKLPSIPTVDNPTGKVEESHPSHFPACVSTGRPSCIFLAVPPSHSTKQISKAPQSASYLQTFDMGAAHQVSRQALARTNITNVNMGPEFNTIEEPNVTHMQISADGQWLATVDKWLPPRRDLASIAFDQGRTAEEQVFRQEIYLKFWLWNDDGKVWELVSRIDQPHASWSGNPYDEGDIFELMSDPSAVGFATVGADCIVKTWKPITRRRNGLEVKSKDGRKLTSWHCKHVIPLESSAHTAQKGPQGAKLAYSQDGSILAAGLQSSVASPIYLIDTYNGRIQSVQTSLYDGPLIGFGLIDKYLVIMSDQLLVRDLVKDQLVYGIELDSHESVRKERISASHLAVDTHHGLFAVVLPKLRNTAKNPTNLRSQLAMFDPMNATPLFQTSLPNSITKLLPTAGKKGFIAIDSSAEIRTFVPKQSLPLLRSLGSENQKSSSRGLGDIFGGDKNAKTLEKGPSQEVGLLDSNFQNLTHEALVGEADAVVVNHERLSEVLDVGPAYALPPVMELFEQVARLYNGRVES